MFVDFIIISGPFLTGMLIFLLLEMGVSQTGSQKRLVYMFMQHPLRVEAVIQVLFLSFPVIFSWRIYQAVSSGGDPSVWSITALFIFGWPILSYLLHRRLLDFKQTLGVGKKKVYDPIFIAKLSVALWIVAFCSFLIGVVIKAYDIYPIFQAFLTTFGFVGTIFIPLRKNLAFLRKDNDDESIEGVELI